jgi:mRNA interferase RelE/StbE
LTTSYRLVFLRDAKKEWDRLDPAIRNQFAKKLNERLGHPHVPSARLSDMPGCYKIKLRAAGYRLVYSVEDERVTVIVVAVGRRDRNAVYKIAAGRVANK